MERQPKVSFLVPCFNLGGYLSEAIDSVFAQTCQDFEIIIVNDGSTESETNRLVRHFDRPRTRVFTTDNRGLAAARNFALAQARGQYVSALDCDDLLQPGFLARTTGALDADPGLTFCSTWLEVFGAEHFVWRQEHCDLAALVCECTVLTASPIRRETLEAVGGYDAERFLYGIEDWDLWLTLLERGHRGTILPEVLFRYRRRPESMSALSARGPVRERVRRTLMEKHRESFTRHSPEVLLSRERDCGELLRTNARLELELEATRAELVRLRRAHS